MAKKNRVRDLKELIVGVESPDYLMNEIMSIIKDSQRASPVSGKYYTFIYYASTPKIVYDQHPLIMAADVTKTGFRGFNYHLNRFAQYNTTNGNRLLSGLYELNEQELSVLRMIPYQKLIKN